MGISQVRHWLYRLGVLRSHRLPGVVVSVGNIAPGGTGKSPMVVTIARYLEASGLSCAVLSRGYRSGLSAVDSAAFVGGGLWMLPLESEPVFADEAKMQSQKLPDIPIVIGANRIKAARRFLAEGGAAPDVWLLDDGFQHWQIERDMDIVLVDAKDGLGRGYVLPSGLLRERPAALARADAVVFTRSTSDHPKATLVESIVKKGVPVVCKATLEAGDLTHVAGPERAPRDLSYAAISAIANPDSFLDSLRSKGVKIVEVLLKPDHSRFTAQDLQSRSASVTAIVTTDKDYSRDPAVFQESKIPVFVLPIEMVLPVDELPKLFCKITNSQV